MEKPYFASCFENNSFSSSPNCGSPYITLVVSRYTNPLLTSGRTFYSSAILCGMCFTEIVMYFGWSIGVLRSIFLTSAVMNFAFAVDTKMLKRHFIVVRYGILFLTSPG